jgi:Fe-Mn family superoxide dismutase
MKENITGFMQSTDRMTVLYSSVNEDGERANNAEISQVRKSCSRRDFLAGMGVSMAALGLASLSSACVQNKSINNKSFRNEHDLYPVYSDGKYLIKDFSRLTKDASLGLSPAIIENHLGLYANYVNNVNNAEAKMRAGTVDAESLKHLAFSLNGMALHDIYFSNMNSKPGRRSAALNRAIDDSFGSFNAYFTNLTEIAKQVEGWSVTALNLLNGKLLNYGSNTHSDNFPAFVIPILALDVYEHAYEMDFTKTGKDQYLEVFSKIIDWDLVSRRYDHLA